MQGPGLIFFLQDKNHRFYQPDADGKIVLSSKAYPLKFSPEGWEDIEVQTGRNKKWFALLRSLNIGLSHVNDGAKIIKHVMLTKGIDEPLYFTICQEALDYNVGVDYGFWHKMLYRALVDLSTYKHEGVKVTVNTIEDSLTKYLESNENTTEELPMNVDEAIWVKMDGIDLREKLGYADIEALDVSRATYGLSFYGPNVNTGNEGDSTGILVQSQTLESTSGLSFPDKLASDNCVLQNLNTTPITFTLVGVSEFKCISMTSAPAYALRRRFLTSTMDISNQNDYQIHSTVGMVPGTTYTQAYTVTITLQPNEKLFLESIFFTGVGSDAVIQFTPKSTFNIAFVTRFRPTYVPHFRAQYLFEQLIYRATEGNYIADLSPLFARFPDVVFTCGDAIRGIKDANGDLSAVMKVSLELFRQFWDCFFSVGISETGGKITLDEKINLVDRVNRIVLPSPASPVKVRYEKGYCFNVLKIGYVETKNDVGILNGRECFCCAFEFTTGTSADPGSLDKISKTQADCYTMEKLRIMLFQKDTTDNKSDNDFFVNWIDSTLQPADGDIPAHYLLDRSLNSTAVGLLEKDSVWNIRLSPKRMLLNNGSDFRSRLFLGDNKILKFKSADKNNKLECGGITEKLDEPIIGLASRFFYPLVMTLELPAPNNLLDLMAANPLATYEVTVDGNVFTGILIKNSISPASNKAQIYELLMDSNNDLTKLIDYAG